MCPCFIERSSDFLGQPLSTFLPVEWGGRAFAYCAENGFSLLTKKSSSFIFYLTFLFLCLQFTPFSNKVLALSLQVSFSPTWLKMKGKRLWPGWLSPVSRTGMKQVQKLTLEQDWNLKSNRKSLHKCTGLPGWEWRSGDLVTGQEGEVQPHTKPLPHCGEWVEYVGQV